MNTCAESSGDVVAAVLHLQGAFLGEAVAIVTGGAPVTVVLGKYKV